MRKTIRYGVDDNGLVWSRVGSEVAIPILDYDGMEPQNNYAANYCLERVPVLAVAREMQWVKWTSKLPVEAKNVHRKFWGMGELRK